MLEDALKYPFRGDDSTRRLLVGGALPFLSTGIYLVGALLSVILVGFLLMPFAIVPRVLLWGYGVVVVSALLAGREDPPGFTDWKRIGIDGLQAAAVALVYSIPLLVLTFGVIGFATVTASLTEQSAGGGGPGTVMGIVWGFFGLLVALYAIGLYYVLPAAIVNFVREDDIAAAFHLRTVKDVVVSGDYLVAWLLAAIVLLVGGIVALPLYFVLVGFVLRFYTIVVAAYLVTRGSMTAMNWTAPLGPDASPAGETIVATPGKPDPAESRTTDPLTERATDPDTRQDSEHGFSPRDENDAPRGPASDEQREGE